ncbi:MAG: gamma-glutamylcyclotransferase family protein [Candidatus Hermodarchaeota archaeon]
MREINRSCSLVSVIGYGTFISCGIWRTKKNVEICEVKDYIRIFPKGHWYPFILPSEGSSFYALKFDITKEELRELDFFEGVSENYFKREIIEVYRKNNEKIQAFIYLPTDQLITKHKLSVSLDDKDKWKEEIKKDSEIIEKFPELIL